MSTAYLYPVLEISLTTGVVVLMLLALPKRRGHGFAAGWSRWGWLAAAVRLLIPFHAPLRVPIENPAIPAAAGGKRCGRLLRRAAAAAAAAACASLTLMPVSAVPIRTQDAVYDVHGGIRGIDVSELQGRIAWKRVAEDDIHFAILRASYGATADQRFEKNVQGAREAGLHVGAYHFATFTDRAAMLEEAEFFLSQLEGKTLDYPVVLDTGATGQKGLTTGELTGLYREFTELLAAKGYKALIYGHNTFVLEHLDADALDCGLWVANYREEPGCGQVLWQHTATGRVDGIVGNVDINIAYGDLSVEEK